jgi:gamma-butyrobetaine dioxygenase
MGEDATGSEVVEVLASMEALPYLGEPVSQLEHSLQCGFQLRSSGADDVLILAGVLHDVGRAPGVTRQGEAHEVTGARWVEERFGHRAGWLVGQHVPAKKVLVTADDQYQAALSKTSIATLRVQGGPATDAEVDEFMAQPWALDALALRRADDEAKQPGGSTMRLDEVGELVERVLANT